MNRFYPILDGVHQDSTLTPPDSGMYECCAGCGHDVEECDCVKDGARGETALKETRGRIKRDGLNRAGVTAGSVAEQSAGCKPKGTFPETPKPESSPALAAAPSSIQEGQ